MFTNSNIKLYRSPDEIYNLIEVLIDSYFSILEFKVGQREQVVLEKLRSIEIEISPQFMEVFQCPLDNVHFKDIIDQSIIPLIKDHIDNAYKQGILTENEKELMHLVIIN